MVEIHIRRDEIALCELHIVCAQELGVIRDDRAVEVVVIFALVNIIAHARPEDEINTLFKQILNMPVCQLCRIADRIRGDGVLSLVIHIAVAFMRELHREAELCKKLRPEGHLLIEGECQRQSDRCNRPLLLRQLCIALLLCENEVIFIIVERGGRGRLRFARAFFTAVSGDVSAAAGEGDDIERTVRRAAAAFRAARGIAEVLDLLLRDRGRLCRRVLLRVERCTECAHQSGDRRADHIASELHFKGTQHGIVEEGAALHDDIFAELLHRFCADDLVDRVLDD